MGDDRNHPDSRGVELTLWPLERRATRHDHEMQQKQLEILDGILTELAIQNAEDASTHGMLRMASEVRNETPGSTTEVVLLAPCPVLTMTEQRETAD